MKMTATALGGGVVLRIPESELVGAEVLAPGVVEDAVPVGAGGRVALPGGGEAPAAWDWDEPVYFPDGDGGLGKAILEERKCGMNISWCCRLVLCAAVLGLAVSASCITNKEPARAEDSEPSSPPQGSSALPEQASRNETISITGQMTLADLEGEFGISAVEIAKKLGLPPDIAQDETFGRLRQNYSFTMDQVREIVEELSPGAGIAAKSVQPEVAGQTASAEEPQLTRGRGSESETGVLITGQMSLREIESRSGVPARVIAEKLRLPRQASLDTPLGKLRRVHRFTMQEVRSIVAEQLKSNDLRPSPPQNPAM